jgi:hypothetical protein
MSEVTGRPAQRPHRTRTIVLGVVVVLLIGVGLVWFLPTQLHVGRHGRVDVLGPGPNRGISAADFTEGVFELSTLDSVRNFHSVLKLQQEGKLIFVHQNTRVVVLYTMPPYSRVRLSYGPEVWIRTESIRLE